jgi:hypothetical protein
MTEIVAAVDAKNLLSVINLERNLQIVHWLSMATNISCLMAACVFSAKDLQHDS